MAYNSFTLEQLKADFGLIVTETTGTFDGVAPVSVSAQLRDALSEGAPPALAISTEKARSELIIAPVLLEMRRQLKGAVGLFSGTDFTVDPGRGLSGFCDFLISRSPEQLTIEAPVIAVVEAKNENMRAGIAQCLAEMVAVQIFNEARGKSQQTTYGTVTTGSNWLFLQLEERRVRIDLTEYYLADVGRIVGILVSMVQGTVLR